MEKKFLWKFIAGLFFAFVLFVIYSANTGTSPAFFRIARIIPFGDKFGHFFLIGILAFLMNIATSGKKIFYKNHGFLLGGVLVFGFFTAEEMSQLFIERRTFDLIDLSFNYLGIFAADRAFNFNSNAA